MPRARAGASFYPASLNAMTDTAHDRLAQFLGESREALLRYVRRLTRSQEAAEDIVQEAAARTLAQGDKVRVPENFLFITARNLAWSVDRAQRTADGLSAGEADALGIAGETPSPEEAMLAREAATLLRQAIARLPPQCRAAFALRVFHAYSYKEIAEQLGISTKTVEKHVTRGLRDTHVFLRRRYQLLDRDAGHD